MHSSHANKLQMIRRVRELVGDRANDPVLQEPVNQLDAALARLRESSVMQDNAARRRRSLTVSIHASARALRRDLLRPAYLAMAAAFPDGSGDVESMRQATRPPAGRTDYERLLVAARSMALAIERHEAQFVAAALPLGFAARLRTAADALEGLIVARATEEQRRVAATRGNASESRRGVALVRLIDALMLPSLRGDPPREAEWTRAVKLSYRPRSRTRQGTPAVGVGTQGGATTAPDGMTTVTPSVTSTSTPTGAAGSSEGEVTDAPTQLAA
jgi:hypothetical protein